ncbi:FAD:protein FMN transferase [Demequina activiva]|uniref:FAD:protein FMN transferase n=1 Tax=Demequina activiva TaxID=1582364 RepID=A0A919PYX2_9MICO|nr:FAD:protein FMN transferase [Demequina activiva]GIG53265.1 FAD:protein FMN transferase [Demequina activiva]
MSQPTAASDPLARTVTAMAMDFTLQAWGPVDPAALDAVMEHVASDLRWVDAVFSTYREDSWISRIGRGEARTADAPPAVAEVLDLCERFREDTGGAFDARTPDGRIDPTGIVKTWAMERARWRLSLVGATGWMWGCAGDVAVSGRGPIEGGWRAGIADPRHPPGPATPVVRRAQLGGRLDALATSGQGLDSGHVWDPRTGEAASHYAQVSVIGRDLVACDAWATAILAGGRRTLQLAQEAGVAALALRVVNGSVRATANAGWAAIE